MFSLTIKLFRLPKRTVFKIIINLSCYRTITFELSNSGRHCHSPNTGAPTQIKQRNVNQNAFPSPVLINNLDTIQLWLRLRLMAGIQDLKLHKTLKSLVWVTGHLNAEFHIQNTCMLHIAKLWLDMFSSNKVFPKPYSVILISSKIIKVMS